MIACHTCSTPARRGTSCPFCGVVLAVGLAVTPSALAAEGPVEAIYGVPTTHDVDSSDRPGVGDSTATVSPRKGLIEAGLALTPQPLTFGTSGILGRFGVHRHVEVRLRVPDLTVAEEFAIGPVGLGSKVAWGHKRWGLSLVPELTFHPQTAQIGASVGLNLTTSVQRVGLWGHATGALQQTLPPSLLVGGGASMTLGVPSLFVHGGVNTSSSGFVGGGAFFRISPTLQLDLGTDFWFAEGTASPVLAVGATLGW